jgi:hypothetical protein
MPIIAVWVALLVLLLTWEFVCRRHPSRWTSLAGLGARLWGSVTGRAALLLVWAFVGWHVFARYTVPG